ncbi:MAG: DNA polymerase III subunit epsilon [Phreatobacter sp.]|uniref:DNA polymerase III subunit epsilon n=1 Tax=Phreatobacter sp. TaxID=1966341 RepID=UPI001A49D489|nr:DNA polymerase III subunit epsilon [Phreatobacter sp.]MBL8571785.1 DNA polymerase III subunit epsilon [Phreatobacter sp.]
MREIILDTETTGLDPLRGDRLVEIGGIELINHFPTGRTYHVYINPERSMPEEAFRVHGLSSEFLGDKPKFAEVVAEFSAFIEGAKLVIHNASFDMGFINAELKRTGRPAFPSEFVIDSLSLARRRFPGGANSLDALCSRFGIDNSRRTKHGALLDAELLAEVYIELIGGKQTSLGLAEARPAAVRAARADVPARARPQPLAPRLSAADIEAHGRLVAELGDKAIWLDILTGPSAATGGGS